MDKVKQYRKMVRGMLSEIAHRFRSNSDWEILEIYDEEHGQYLLYTDGWKNESRDYGCFMHIEVKDNGIIWLRRDGTDLDIGQQILDQGVTKKEMVIGFHSPMMRSWTDFAQG